MDPVNCFEQERTDYSKYDTIVEALQLSALELAILNCYMNGMVQSEVCAELGIGRGRSITAKLASERDIIQFIKLLMCRFRKNSVNR